MAPKKKKKNAGKGSKSEQQRGSSSTAVQSPASEPLEILAEAAASDAPSIPSTQPPPSQEQSLSSTTHPGATPACPPVASFGLHSLSHEERVTIQYSFLMAGGPAAVAHLHEMSKLEDRSLVWLEQGLRIMSSTFPYLTLMVKTLNGLWDKRDVEVVLNAIVGTLEDMGVILDGYSMMTKVMVNKLKQGRGGSCSHGGEEGGSSSGGDRGGGSSATAI
ncbi:hypothetical protein OPV22_033227 [Ensete ventricosum]|uniref:Uncharacterized protein n=1 Tax=Ensete ventricosum TaxID=4639 RepID=A0AAV8P0S5_ENSVE|nr:hypothetical protein OPV22_033227 [Ensete ventricosum]RWV84747.1 hypothetical protein GW17_00053519 [Ensete ventricosum]RWW64441.1 hypothetical protein BHE74_00028325 [Ensete ventricosum]RZR88264.1 hypothetical protein BHM03_00015801 [Ensete ventricosum]